MSSRGDAYSRPRMECAKLRRAECRQAAEDRSRPSAQPGLHPFAPRPNPLCPFDRGERTSTPRPYGRDCLDQSASPTELATIHGERRLPCQLSSPRLDLLRRGGRCGAAVPPDGAERCPRLLAAGVAIGPSGFALIGIRKPRPRLPSWGCSPPVHRRAGTEAFQPLVDEARHLRPRIRAARRHRPRDEHLRVRAGLTGTGAFVTGVALGLSATAIALQMLEERDDLRRPTGRNPSRSCSSRTSRSSPCSPFCRCSRPASRFGRERKPRCVSILGVAKALGAIAIVVVIGRYGLNPFFRVLADSGAREVMTASALLVVLGAAALMEAVGLSMAMGAFLAGLLLAESNFRHQLEADIEPFRGMLLGLFFMSVGMSIDAGLVRDKWLILLIVTPVVILGKTAVIIVLSLLFGATWREGLRSGVLLCHGGRVRLRASAPRSGSRARCRANPPQLVTALAALTMLFGPMTAKLVDILLERIAGSRHATGRRPGAQSERGAVQPGPSGRVRPFRPSGQRVSARPGAIRTGTSR